jgi:hypothetical protein
MLGDLGMPDGEVLCNQGQAIFMCFSTRQSLSVSFCSLPLLVEPLLLLDVSTSQ